MDGPREGGERFLVTGALGCIGAWVVRELVAEGAGVTALDAGRDPYRLRYLLRPEELAAVALVEGDVTDLAALRAALAAHAVTNVIHLAGLQVPTCRANPSLGAMVNVVGTVNVFEAVKGTPAAARPVVYASSIAAYGDADAVPGGAAPAEPRGRPQTHYGVFKAANEGNARVFWADGGIASLGLRPYVVYGVGRDFGMTSSPTLAMLAAAQGRAAHISYGGRSHMQHAADVARAFVRASRSGYRGAAALNLGGSVVHMREVVAAIEAAAPEAAGRITFDDQPLPFPGEVDATPFEQVLGPLPATPLAEGVADTVTRFRALLAGGRLAPAP